MKRSTDHILTSHVGTLPRPEDLQQLLATAENSQDEYFQRLPQAVVGIVQKQLDVGLDVINDGEFGKVGGFSGYVRTRLSGWEQKPLQQPSGGSSVSSFPATRSVEPADNPQPMQRHSGRWFALGRFPTSDRQSSTETSRICVLPS